MRTYRIEKHQAYADDKDFVADVAVEDANGNWVPADVAQGLYEALDQAVTSMQDSGYPNSNVAVQAARAALTAADGDGGGDD